MICRAFPPPIELPNIINPKGEGNIASVLQNACHHPGKPLNFQSQIREKKSNPNK